MKMNETQFQEIQRLIPECCNYLDGNCTALDDGQSHVCVQSISRSLICKWFCTSVLPINETLYAAIKSNDSKTCANCGKPFLSLKSNKRYCNDCAKRRERESKKKWARQNRDMCRKSAWKNPHKY